MEHASHWLFHIIHGITKRCAKPVSTSAFESGIRGAVVVDQISAIARVGEALKRAVFVSSGLSGCLRGDCQALCRVF